MKASRAAALGIDLAHEAARGEHVVPELLHLLDRAVGADVLNSSMSTAIDGGRGPDLTVLHGEPLTVVEEREWRRLLPLHPFAASLCDGRPRTARLTDRISVRELERLELYQLLLAPRGHTYQLAATLASSPAHLSLVSLWRRTCDFTDAEVEVVEVVRRAITAALDYRSAHQVADPPLSPSGRLGPR